MQTVLLWVWGMGALVLTGSNKGWMTPRDLSARDNAAGRPDSGVGGDSLIVVIFHKLLELFNVAY